ncbi:MAG: hypothetical protein HY506_01040 [Candidatus Yanofskybacteria bacterium]|nr:hypothetical protein [Candidatus Yanofskybacteria bacterium]
MKEKISQPPNFYESLQHLLDFFEPDQGRYLRLLRAKLTDEERELLVSNNYTVIEVKTMEELLSDNIKNLLLNGQAIQTGKGGTIRPDLPPKLALVMPPDLREQAMLKDSQDWAGDRFSDIWRREGQYATTLDESNPY